MAQYTTHGTDPPTISLFRGSETVSFLAERIEGFPVITMTAGTLAALDDDDLSTVNSWADGALRTI
jgi:hypothetical protein